MEGWGLEKEEILTLWVPFQTVVNPKRGPCFFPSRNWATVACPEHHYIPLYPRFPESYLPPELPGRWDQDLASLKDPEQGI